MLEVGPESFSVLADRNKNFADFLTGAADPMSEVSVNEVLTGVAGFLSRGRAGGQGTTSSALFLEPPQEERWSVVDHVSLGTQLHLLPVLVT